MKNVDFPDEMRDFLMKHHAMSVAVCKDDVPWSATCYYTFDPDYVRLIFVSDPQTRHMSNLLLNNRVSGTISNDERNILLIKGVQFSGRVFRAEVDYLVKAKKQFVKKFPFAFLKKLTLWFVEIDYVKMTDNSKFFSAKTHWKRNI